MVVKQKLRSLISCISVLGIEKNDLYLCIIANSFDVIDRSISKQLVCIISTYVYDFYVRVRCKPTRKYIFDMFNRKNTKIHNLISNEKVKLSR